MSMSSQNQSMINLDLKKISNEESFFVSDSIKDLFDSEQILEDSKNVLPDFNGTVQQKRDNILDELLTK